MSELSEEHAQVVAAEARLEGRVTPLFGDASGGPCAFDANRPDTVRAPVRESHTLQSEVTSIGGYPRSATQELQSMNQNLPCANEELYATNDELRMAHEQLESSNRELSRLNTQIALRNAELGQLNSDLLNLLSSTHIPIVMAGNDLCIRRFTPMAKNVLDLIPADVGRPISEVKRRLDVADLEIQMKRVIDTLLPSEQEVKDVDGRSYLMRMRPYLTTDHRIEGAVLHLLDVTSLKQSMDRVNHALAYAEAIVDTIHEPLAVLDRILRIRDANRAFYDALGMPAGAGAGRGIYEVAGGVFDIPAVHALDDLILDQAQLKDLEIAFSAGDGETRTFLVNARCLRSAGDDFILLAFEDVTERRRSEEARYRRLFESARDGIAIVDADTGEILDVNPFFRQLLGYDSAELVGRKLWDLEPLESAAEARAIVAQILNDGMISLPDLSVRLRNGGALCADVIANLYSDKHRRLIQFNFRDVTERRKSEREAQERQSLETLGLLAGGIAHDFNNILTGIMGNASLGYVKLPPEEPVRQNLRDIELASEKAAYLTRQMLAYAGQGRYETRRIHIGELISEIATVIRSTVPRAIAVEIDIAETLPPMEADTGQVQQVVMNLVTNAAEALGDAESGRIGISTSLRSVSEAEARREFSAEKLAPGRYIQLAVSDSGCGMDEATLSRIFDPFFTTKFTGRGLGLAASQGTVRSHGGAIRVSSAPGAGSTFSVLFPAAT